MTSICDLPIKIINEIILCVPLIDLFRLSKVCKQFKKLTYKSRGNITNEKEYISAIEKGDILSLLKYSLSYYTPEISHVLIGKHINNWNTELIYACKKGHMEIVHLMIYIETNNAICRDKNKSTEEWNLRFYYACEGGHMDIVQLLIEYGANDWNGGLYAACEGGHMVNRETRDTKCPLAGQGARNATHFLEIVQLLIEKGANDWDWGLSGACYGGNMDIVQLIISKASKQNTNQIKYLESQNNGTIQTSDWNEGLSCACHAGHMNIVMLMIEKGANDWNTGLHYACLGYHMVNQDPRQMHACIEIVQFMISKGADECGYCDKSIRDH